MRRTLSLALLVTLAVQAHAQLTLPYSGTDATATLSSFQITKSGSAGRANTLYISNASNTSDVLLVNTVGLGRAAYFTITNAANNQIALRADSNGSGTSMFGFMTGTGRAGFFRITNAASTNVALHAQTNGSGPALRAEAGTGLAGDFLGGVKITKVGTALQVFGGSTFTDTATFATAEATQFIGGGSGLSNLYAGNITTGTLDSARLPVPLSLTGSSGGAIISGENTNVGGIGVFGYASAASGSSFGGRFESLSPNGIGLFGKGSGATAFGVWAQNLAGGIALATTGRSRFDGNVELFGSANLSIGAGTPAFPVDFPETLGNKISLWGTSATSHYGFGIQSGTLQIFSDSLNSGTAFGYGGSGNFTERARFTSNAELVFRADDLDYVSSIAAPYDIVISRDRDNSNTLAWLRFYTNSIIEQMRIEDGDEAGTFFDGAVVANGIDFAEAFKVADSSLEAGDLVINHGNDWEYITRSRGAYDQGVIGVVSTKPAFVAGMSFDAEDNMDLDLTRRRDEARVNKDEKLEKQLTLQMRDLVQQAYRPVAFMGRVPVKVTGAVRVGDHLTASSVPGVAMAMTRAGQSVGIALEPSAGGSRKIMAMIQPGFYAPMAPAQVGDVNAELTAVKSQMNRVLAENSDLRSRLERLEQAMKNR